MTSHILPLALRGRVWSNVPMVLRAHAGVEIARPIADVFDYSVAAENFPAVMTSRGLIPGVTNVVLMDTTTLATGVRRRVELTDDSYVLELVTDLSRPKRHAYRWDSKLKFPLSLLVSGAEAEWIYSSTANGGTRIDWNYTFTPTTVLVYPLAAIMVSQFRGWMQQTLGKVRTSLAAN